MNDVSNNPKGKDLALHFTVLSNSYGGKEQFRAELELSNNSEFTLRGNWCIYFNFIRKIFPNSIGKEFEVTHINGDFFQLKPTKYFSDLKSEEKVCISFNANFWAIKKIDAPTGFYIVYQNEKSDELSPQNIESFAIGEFVHPEQLKRTPEDFVPIETAELRYKRAESLNVLPKESLTPILPTPVFLKKKKGFFKLFPSSTIAFQPHLLEEANNLKLFIKQHVGIELTLIDGVIGDIVLSSSQLEDNSAPLKTANNEAYSLSINSFGVQINGLFPAGAFHGIQSFLQLIPVSSETERTSFAVPYIEVQDQPKFSYRGIHLDVARNFHEVSTVKKLLDLMSFYKLNKFHFHLTDDEGWRLEIQDLPELTEVGGRRGHNNQTQATCLVPSYGSGSDPNDPHSSGNGYYSRESFMELLQYANKRHIEIIPAIDFPGHARAAVQAMELRYNKFKAVGDLEKANEYLLTDWADTSEYESVQMWHHNVINIALPSTYRFIEKVFNEIILLYKEANVKLNTIHVGGDEVPEGSWLKSPACNSLIHEHPELRDVHDLSEYFIKKVYGILIKKGIKVAGWEEIALTHKNGSVTPHKSLLNRDLTTYTWNTMWGTGNEEIPYKLANLGYKVVLSNAPNLYFDLAYNKDPEEAGYYWAGYTDTLDVFTFIPFDFFKGAVKDAHGNEIDPKVQYQKAERLSEKGKSNILGIQAQLWGETIRSKERLEYLLFPRLCAMAERAWSQEPKWAELDDSFDFKNNAQEAWCSFANRLAQIELPRLDYLFDCVSYRIPMPGALYKNGILQVNITLPGFTIRYTTDGSEPTPNSEIYLGPLEIRNKTIKLKTFTTNNRCSRTTVVNAYVPEKKNKVSHSVNENV